jgi:hypothetical protein
VRDRLLHQWILDWIQDYWHIGLPDLHTQVPNAHVTPFIPLNRTGSRCSLDAPAISHRPFIIDRCLGKRREVTCPCPVEMYKNFKESPYDGMRSVCVSVQKDGKTVVGENLQPPFTLSYPFTFYSIPRRGSWNWKLHPRSTNLTPSSLFYRLIHFIPPSSLCSMNGRVFVTRSGQKRTRSILPHKWETRCSEVKAQAKDTRCHVSDVECLW